MGTDNKEGPVKKLSADYRRDRVSHRTADGEREKIAPSRGA
jgi:hypothetical protein